MITTSFQDSLGRRNPGAFLCRIRCAARRNGRPYSVSKMRLWVARAKLLMIAIAVAIG